MLGIKGIYIDQFPFTDLRLISNLISFDGEPFLQHYQDYKKNDIISYLVDYDDKKSRWLYSKVTSDELLDYLTQTIPLKHFLSNLQSDLKFFIEVSNTDGKITGINFIQDDVNEKYLPKDESFFPIEMPDIYADRINNYTVINAFLKNGVFIKVDPTEVSINRGLIRAIDGAELLSSVSNSFDNKVEKEVEDKFISVGITDEKRIGVAQKEVAKLYTMNIARVKIASFAVALCPNHIINIGEQFLDRDWMLNVLKSFKTDVIEIGSKSVREVDDIIKKYQNRKELKAIYEPIIKLYQNKNIAVSLTDSAFKDEKPLRPIADEIVSKLIFEEPKIPPIEIERLAKVMFNEKTNRPTLSSGYTLFEQDIETSWETKKIEIGEYIFNLYTPLFSRYNIINDLHTLENPMLGIYAAGESKSEAITDFNNQFLNLFTSLTGDNKKLGEEDLKKKTYLEVHIANYEKKQ